MAREPCHDLGFIPENSTKISSGFKEIEANLAAPKFPEKMGLFHGINGFLPIPILLSEGLEQIQVCAHFSIKNTGKSWNSRGKEEFQGFGMDLGSRRKSWNSSEITGIWDGFGIFQRVTVTFPWIWDPEGKAGIPGSDREIPGIWDGSQSQPSQEEKLEFQGVAVTFPWIWDPPAAGKAAAGRPSQEKIPFPAV